MTYTVVRRGTFKGRFVSQFQCGLMTQRIFSFRISATFKKLDNKAFGIDNLVLQQVADMYDSAAKWKVDSCEAVANGFLHELHSRCHQNGNDLVSAKITIIPNDLADVTLDWDGGDKLPRQVPRKA